MNHNVFQKKPKIKESGALTEAYYPICLNTDSVNYTPIRKPFGNNDIASGIYKKQIIPADNKNFI